MSKKYMITTFDNPFSPFDEFDQWYLCDIEKGYNTCERLARFAHTSEEFTDEENETELNEAIDDLIKHDVLGVYKRVTESDYKPHNKDEA